MFKAKINGSHFKESIAALRVLVGEARFVVGADGIDVSAVDPANVAMVHLSLPSSVFESYEATGAELGIDLVKLADQLELAASDEVVGLELDEKSHRLVLTMRGLSYTMALLDPSSIRKSPKLPNLVLPGLVVIDGGNFKHGIKASEKVSDYVRIGIVGETFFMQGDGDVDKVRFELTRSQLLDMRSADVDALFSLDYLMDISKASAKSERVSLEIGKDMPIKVSHSIAGGGGSVSYITAPRVESV